MVVNNAMELTEDEEALYDRQIRLWGLESQKRLRKARVLIVGISGLGAEIVKNIILAGVKSVRMLDNAVVSELDSHCQFLSPTDTVGLNRAQASLNRAQALNSLVTVSADTGKISDKPDEYFAPWEVIIATGQTTEDLIRLNSLCRANSVKFFCGDVFGVFGYMFADLQSHEFVEEVSTMSSKPVGNGSSMKIKVQTVTNSVKSKMEFPSLDDALEVDFSSEENLPKLPKMEPSYFIMKILMRFRREKGRNPDPAHVEDDMKSLREIRDAELSYIPYPKEKITDEIFRMIFSQVSPVCAIVGGVLTQEVVKAVSQKDVPLNNMFFFNPLTNCGHVVCVGN